MSTDTLASKLGAKPWRCPEHPDSMIRHEFDQTQYMMNGYPAGQPISRNHVYRCNECGRELEKQP